MLRIEYFILAVWKAGLNKTNQESKLNSGSLLISHIETDIPDIGPLSFSRVMTALAETNSPRDENNEYACGGTSK